MEKRKRILITGAAGYIADSIIETLLTVWHGRCEILAVDSLMYTDSYMRPGIAFRRLDIRSDDFFDLLTSWRPDVIIHMAAIVGDGACQANPELTIDVNEKFVGKLVNIISPSTRLITASTCSVYGASHGILNEDSETSPLSLYAGTKLRAEDYIRNHPNHVIFRLGTIFGLSGPFGRIRTDLVVNVMTFKAIEGQRLSVFGGEQYRPLLHVKDAGDAFAAAAFRDFTGTYILSSQNYTIGQIADEVAQFFRNVEVEKTSMKFEDLRNYRVSNEKILLTGFIPRRTLSEGIWEIIENSDRIKNPWVSCYNNARYIGDLCQGNS